MPERNRLTCLLLMLFIMLAACDKKNDETAAGVEPNAASGAGGVAAPEPQIQDYFKGAQIMAAPGGIPQNLKSMVVKEIRLIPVNEEAGAAALSDGKPETLYRMQIDRSNNPAVVYRLGPVEQAAPFYGVYLNIRNAAEEGRKPIDYRPFVLSIKFRISDGGEAEAVAPAAPALADKPDGDGEDVAVKAPQPAPPTLEEISSAIDSGEYLALVNIEWKSLNGEQVALFDRPFEFSRDRKGELSAEISYIFGEEQTRFLEISELNLLSPVSAAGANDPLPLDKLAVPPIAGCYRNREGRRVDIYASGMLRVAVPGSAEAAPQPKAEVNRSPQGAPPAPQAASDDKFGYWRLLNERLYFNIGGDGELSCAAPGAGPWDLTPELTGLQRDPACSDPWGDIGAQLAAAGLGSRNDIGAVWRSDCDGDRRPELVVYLKDKKKAVILRHSNDWEAYSLWREMELSGDFRIYTEPVSGNCMLCEKDDANGGWWINIYLSNNWYRSRRLTLPGD